MATGGASNGGYVCSQGLLYGIYAGLLIIHGVVNSFGGGLGFKTSVRVRVRVTVATCSRTHVRGVSCVELCGRRATQRLNTSVAKRPEYACHHEQLRKVSLTPAARVNAVMHVGINTRCPLCFSAPPQQFAPASCLDKCILCLALLPGVG